MNILTGSIRNATNILTKFMVTFDLSLSLSLSLSHRCDKLLGLLDYWQRYEKEVKDLLSWIMDEANKFSKEVTTRGDKGIEDHIESCKVSWNHCYHRAENFHRMKTLLVQPSPAQLHVHVTLQYRSV